MHYTMVRIKEALKKLGERDERLVIDPRHEDVVNHFVRLTGVVRFDLLEAACLVSVNNFVRVRLLDMYRDMQRVVEERIQQLSSPPAEQVVPVDDRPEDE